MKNFIETYYISMPNIESNCYIFNEVSSTLDTAYKLFKEGKLQDWDSVIAYHQTKGRGQLGHTWHSSEGNMYATLILPLSSFFNTQAIAPIIGGIVIECLMQTFKEEVKLRHFEFCAKWTNDLLIKSDGNYYKIGGILVEQRDDVLLAGIGINLKSAPILQKDEEKNALIPSSISKFIDFSKITSIPFDNEKSVNSLWERLVKHTFLCYSDMCLNDTNTLYDISKDKQELKQDLELFTSQKMLLSKANSYLAFKNQIVRISDALVFGDFDISSNNEYIFEYTGELIGISLESDSLGGIIIDTSLGRRTFMNGSIRLA